MRTSNLRKNTNFIWSKTVVVALGLCSGVAACSGPADAPTEARVNGAISAVTLDDDSFRSAVACPDCATVHRSHQVVLPLTGKAFTRAKLSRADGTHRMTVALDQRGTAVDAQALFAAEGAAVIARQGKLRNELHALSQSSSAGTVPVWIWADVSESYPPKEQMIADPLFRAAHEARHADDVRAVTSKIIAWLDARGYLVYDRGSGTPSVLADVPVAALAELGRLEGVAAVGYRQPMQPAATDAWFDTVKATAAQAIVASASGQLFCNAEGYQPDSYSMLNVPSNQIASPGGATSAHTRWTTELVSGLRRPPDLGGKLLAMAPSATTFIANSNLFSGGEAGVWHWCWERGADAINASVQPDGLAAGGLSGWDMTTDYYVKHFPYPVITESAGNCLLGNQYTCTGNSQTTVGNRGFNVLVVGASNDQGTTSTSDDTLAVFSAFTNPQTTHHDYELPHLVAPGVDIDSASAFDAGTSASAPITLGAVLLARTRDGMYTYWPEMSRASVLATATKPVSGSRTTTVSGGSDLKHGAGLLNAAALVKLADSANLHGPNSTAAKMGHYATTYAFGTDFPGNTASPYLIKTTTTGRLRAAITWDSSAVGCSTTDGSGCTGDALDADLDLTLYKQVNGQWIAQCFSNTFDSSWELCDVAANNGDNFKAEITLSSNVTASTYFGIAWYNYTTSSE